MVAAEMSPYIKTGGLADVLGALPHALHAMGHDVRVVIPRYGLIDGAQFNVRVLCERIPVPIDDGVDFVTVEQTMSGEVPVWLMAHGAYFNRDGVSMYDDDDRRFVFLCRAALESIRQLDWQPDVIHCHDWQTAMIPHLLRTTLANDPWFQGIATLLTIHNLAFQGVFGHRVLQIAGVPRHDFEVVELPNASDSVRLLAGGIYYADIINSVSPSYAHDMLEPESGEGLDTLLRSRRDRVYGVLNGIDSDAYDPQHDPAIGAPFAVTALQGKHQCKRDLQQLLGLNVSATTPLLVMVSRLTTLKGFDVIDACMEALLGTLGVQLVVMGTGQQRFHDRLTELRARFPQQLAFRLTFDEVLARRMVAGADVYLMPSRIEPCGTAQMIAMRYGAVPVVHATGGLKDTVRPYNDLTSEGNGFAFSPLMATELMQTLTKALDMYAQPALWRQLMIRGMTTDFSWRVAAKQYADLYRRALTAHMPL
jgi:starch synthase